MINLRILLLGLILIVSSCQPDSKEKKDGRVSDGNKKIAKVDIAEIEAGIKTYIENREKEGEGYFHLSDSDHDLQLKLVRVHTEYLSNLGPGRFFACVDLADVSGDVYDVDFFMEGEPGNMTVTETTVHKLNGKPNYTWKQQKDKTWYRVPVEGASTDLLGVIEGQDEFEFSYRAKLPKITEGAKMWIPMAKSDSFQTVNLVSLRAPGTREILEEKENGNTILYLELEPGHSDETVEIIYHVKRLEKGPYEEKEAFLDKYLGSNRLMPVDRRFREIALEAIGDKRKDSKLMQARAIYDYIIDNMRYMKYGDYGKGDAVYACDAKTGNCTEFHSLFISLARSVDIPARFSIGASIPSERNEGGIDGYHCWAEFYAEGKWWPVDISEGNKYTALATYYFGRHPANRIELSHGRDIEIVPGPEAGPINFLVFPILEVGGKPAIVETTFSFTRNS
ncbi:transglutaminase domain-containing protein [Negadavirga shengliensis]|uniref:Transglutaminase domain-containing protein n=1 Tax=Negadavirga shengliensis TaxID=1389218 RepID=A0ABV9T1H3_9BACT